MKDDVISRQAAIETALTYLVEYCGAAFDENMQRMLKERLDSLPSAQSETTHMFEGSIKDSLFFYCEECGEPVHSEYNYCPRCGRKFEVVEWLT